MSGPLLVAHALTAFYGDFQALYGIDFAIQPGEVVAIIGANGAGKSTFLRCLVNLAPGPANGIELDGQSTSRLAAHEVVRLGVSLVPEGRRLFPSLTVEENLRIAAAHARQGPWNLTAIYRLFPGLEERRTSAATLLSGGQQQMVAIGRALIGNPRLLLCDELSLGLAPTVIKDIYAALPAIRATGTAVVLVEQDVSRAMQASDRVYCFQEGRVSLTGRSNELTRDDVKQAYFGLH